MLKFYMLIGDDEKMTRLNFEKNKIQKYFYEKCSFENFGILTL